MSRSPSPAPRTGTEANNQFAFDLYAHLVRPNENLCFSPFSITTALAMVHAGARGETARQIESLLHFPPGKVLSPAGPSTGCLQVANAMWAHDGYPIRAEYVQVLQKRFDAEIRSVDFEHEAEPVRRIINDWVSRRTRGKINDLIDPPLNPMTRLILTNAVYFISEWESAFKPQSTRSEPFFIDQNRTVDAPLMRKQLTVRMIDQQTYHGAELEFIDGPSMWVLLPKKGVSLAEVEASLSWQTLAEQLNSARHREVMLYLPRFKVRGKFELRDVLKRLGVHDAFSDRADLSGIHEPNPLPLEISDIIHESFTDVNEERAEAGAATATVMRGGRGGYVEPVELRLDRPFLFIIRDSSPGAILFLGRVMDPTRE